MADLKKSIHMNNTMVMQLISLMRPTVEGSRNEMDPGTWKYYQSPDQSTLHI
jgi:hypothetical protein